MESLSLRRPPLPSRKRGSPRVVEGSGNDWWVSGWVGGMEALEASTGSIPMVVWCRPTCADEDHRYQT